MNCGHNQTTDDFVVYFDDEDGGLDLIRRCVPSKLFKQHFAQFAETGLDTANTTEEERIEKYFDDPYTYEKQILALRRCSPPARSLAAGFSSG